MAEGKRKTLGMGLSALFGEAAAEEAEVRRPTRTVPIEQIHPNPAQPRRSFDEEKLESLAASMREKGILQPLLVRPHPSQTNAYELVAGERRWRAAQRARIHDIPVIVRALSDRETLEIALVENVQREDLNPLEEAQAYDRLIREFEYTQDDIARAIGKSRSHIANTLRLTAGTEKVRRYLTEGKLSAGHARALLGAAEGDRIADDIVDKGLTVRQAEALVLRPARAAKPSPPRPADTVELERELSERWGLSVRFRSTNGKGGELVVAYRDLDQLDGFIARVK